MALTLILNHQAITIYHGKHYDVLYRERNDGVATSLKEKTVMIKGVNPSLELCFCAVKQREFCVRYDDIIRIQEKGTKTPIFPYGWADVGDLID